MTVFVAWLISVGVLLGLVLLAYLNTKWVDRQRKLIQAGKKPAWGRKKKC